MTKPSLLSLYKTLISLSVIFFLIGFLSTINDVFIPFFKAILHLDYFESLLLQFVFFIAYGIASIPSAYLANYLGYLRTLRISLALCTVGLFLGVVSCWMPNQFLYISFLFSIFIVALGVVMLLVVVEPYVVFLGNRTSSSSRLTLLQGIHSFGAIIAPWFIGTLLFSPTIMPNNLATAISAVKASMWILALGLLAITILFYFLPLIELNNQKPTVTTQKETMSFPKLGFGWLALFFYVGAEVTIPALLVNFSLFVSKTHLSRLDASHYVSFYWAGILLGRFVGGFMLRFIQAEKIMILCAISALILLAISITAPYSSLAIWAMVSIGLSNSIMFPTIYSLTIQNFRNQALISSGILATAISGGGIISILQGVTADHFGLLNSFTIPMACYIVILAYIIWRKLTLARSNN